MKTQHTAAPWKAQRRGGSDYGYEIVADSGRRVIAETICAEHEPNARLIAAAPGMLEVLINAANWLQVAVNDNAFEDCAMPKAAAHVLAQALALINKVKGYDDAAY